MPDDGAPEVLPIDASSAELITVVEHDPAWPTVFEQIRADLAAALATGGAPVLAIEHVGSTSVPGLPAKPIIDIDIVVATIDDVPTASDALESAGYVARGTMGVDQRWAFLAPAPPARNVYVTVDGCLSLRNHIGVRDVLRSDPALAAEYGALKQSLASRLTVAEIDAYVEAKSTVLQRVLTTAGLDETDLAVIEHTNRAPDSTEPANAVDDFVVPDDGRVDR